MTKEERTKLVFEMQREEEVLWKSFTLEEKLTFGLIRLL